MSTDPSLPFPTITIPLEKKRSLRSLIRLAVRKRDLIPARLLASVVGSCRAISPAMPQAAIYLRPAYACLRTRSSWEALVTLTEEACEQLELLFSCLHHWDGCRTVLPPPTLILYTDASKSGWGGWTALVQSPDKVIDEASAFFSARLSNRSSNFRELSAVHLSLQALRTQIVGHSILLMTDNITTLTNLNKFGGKSLLLSRLTQKILALLHSLNCHLVARHIPGVINERADWLSRRTDHGDEDWMLNPSVFQILDLRWGPHLVDRFASAANSQLPRFNSRFWDVGSEAVDALSQPWTHVNNYMNPPFSLILRVLRKIQDDRASATIVVPLWIGRPWFPLLRQMTSDFLILPPLPDLFIRGQPGNIRRLLPPSWKVLACRILSGGF
jgi:hypothetical protein